MRLDYAFKMVRKKYEAAKSNPCIQKPVAFALYQAWKYADEHEKPRKGETMKNSTYRCILCGEEYEADEVKEWKKYRDEFSMEPFICPDCYDVFSRRDPEEQAKMLLDAGQE